jgi:colicin import membrane protein
MFVGMNCPCAAVSDVLAEIVDSQQAIETRSNFSVFQDHAIDSGPRAKVPYSSNLDYSCAADVATASARVASSQAGREAPEMSERKESSVLFNLKELMSLEEERIQTEQAEAQRQLEEETRRKAEEDAQRIADENARRKAEEDARLDADRREREDNERRQREREAAALRVRLEAEAALRSKEQERQLQHELHLKQLESQRRKGIPPMVVAAVALIACAGLAYGYFGVYKPEQARIAAEVAEKERLAQEQAVERQRIADALAEKEREAERLGQEKARMEEAARVRAEQAAQVAARRAAAAAAADQEATSTRRDTRKPGGKDKPKEPKKTGADDDPLKGLDDL